MKPGDDVRAGDLDQRVTLSEPVYNNRGDRIEGYNPVHLRVPAAKRSMRGREMLDAGRDVSEHWAIFTIRYRPDVTERMRITHRNEDWNIEAVDNVNGSDRKLELTCKRVK